MTNNSSHENPAFDNLSSLDRIPQQIYPTSIYAISNQQNAPSQISTGPLPRKKQSILSNSKFRKYLLAGIIISIVFIIVIIGLVVALIVINGGIIEFLCLLKYIEYSYFKKLKINLKVLQQHLLQVHLIKLNNQIAPMAIMETIAMVSKL